jgi:predicted nucleic acid-binding protein
VSETVYLETSIFGYLTARPTENLIVAANMKVTQDWWATRRSFFTLYASEIVEDEAAKGDREVATQRLELLESMLLLDLNEAAIELAQEFLQQSNLPAKASNDALHIALATVYGLDYLLTWNCKPMANAQIQKKLSQISSAFGYELPIICTPYELLGNNAREE